MITSKAHPAWQLDVAIADHHAVRLSVPSIVRVKLFTLDHQIITGRIGRLLEEAQGALSQALDELFYGH